MDGLLTHAVQHGASDIHFKVGASPAYRIDGTLRTVKCDALKPADTRAICATLIGDELPPDEMHRLQEHDTSYSIPGVARFRVNVYRQRNSFCSILRVIPSHVPTIDEMKLPGVVAQLADLERGLVLVTGATGSGKSTTLAAMVDRINKMRPVHILTIEDPIEFLHNHQVGSISQREVGPDTEGFTTALRAALRQDPDVILVGEMRDTETFDIALKAAETGHMVYSTVHTTDAPKTINRLIGMFPPEEQNRARVRLGDALGGIISQRLLARADAKGRVAAMEILIANETVRDHLKEGRDSRGLKDLMEKGGDQYGMQTFDHHLLRLYKGGEITLDVAKAAATSPGDLMHALNFGDSSAADALKAAPTGEAEEKPSWAAAMADSDEPSIG